MQSGARPTSAARHGVSFTGSALQQAPQSLDVVKPRTPGYLTCPPYTRPVLLDACYLLPCVQSLTFITATVYWKQHCSTALTLIGQYQHAC